MKSRYPPKLSVKRPDQSLRCWIVTVENYQIRASRRRTRTMSVFRDNGQLIVAIPATMTVRQQKQHIPPLVQKFLAQEQRRQPPRGDNDLTTRAQQLWRQYLSSVVGEPPVFGVRWTSRQQHRWGSCTKATGEIRISDRLRTVPDWVTDYVLMHEIVHLIEHDHTPRFWDLVARYPKTERARGFLEGLDHARQHGLAQPAQY